MSFLLSLSLFSQGFPEAQKQPRPVEMRKQHKKYVQQGKRRHHRMKTVGSQR
jgi:hypothetical protein